MRRLLISIIYLLLIIFPQKSKALIGKIDINKNPKIANYYLSWDLNEKQAKDLSQWDVLVLDMEVMRNSPKELKMLRDLNPNIILLAYVNTTEIRDDACLLTISRMRCELKYKIPYSWYIKDNAQKWISVWPETHLINVTDGVVANDKEQKWNDLLPDFVFRRIFLSGLWDGVFYDTLYDTVYWINDGNLDLDNDHLRDNISEADKMWRQGMVDILKKTRDYAGKDMLIVGNGSPLPDYQKYLNGLMFEQFPTPWVSDGTWVGILDEYAKVKEINLEPQIHIINATGNYRDNYDDMRYTLASTLMTDAYFSFDYSPSDHRQTWYYDEYNIQLNNSVSVKTKIDNGEMQNGVWKRNFENGVVIVNPNDKSYTAELEFPFKRISRTQNRLIKNKETVTSIHLNPYDGAILLNDFEPYNVVLLNNVSYDIYDYDLNLIYKGYTWGTSYYKSLEPTSIGENGGVEFSEKEIAYVDVNNDNNYEYVHGTKFKETSTVQIRSRSDNGLLGAFNAYPKKFKCGVVVEIGDFDGDGEMEIATLPVWGGPHLKFFNFYGKLKREYFWQDKNIRAFYDIESQDINKDGKDEIILGMY